MALKMLRNGQGGPLLVSCLQQHIGHERRKMFPPYRNKLLGFLHRSVASSSGGENGSNILSVAIVGSGPSGFYTAKYLKSEVERLNTRAASIGQQQYRLHIDIIEKLPTPFGLVRFGVAPDHPETKNVENDFCSVISTGCNTTETTINYVGNVTVGTHVSLQELLGLYNVVVLAYGCNSDNKLLDQSDDNMMGIVSAREFVAWYNGHPQFLRIGEQIAKMITRTPNMAHIVIVGQGNVALDCARILAKGANGLLDTDMASHALPILQGGVKQVTIIGRRGHVQGAFTIKELRELTKLMENGYNTSFTVFQDELDLGMTPASFEELQLSRPKLRIDKLLRECAVPISGSITSSSNSSSNSPEAHDEEACKNITLRFLLNPIQFLPSPKDSSRVGSVLCERTSLEGNAGTQNAVSTGTFEELKADLVLVSIGYKGEPLPGLDGDSFDHRKGIVNHVHGKVKSSSNSSSVLPQHGLYASGWIKRGPSGIIGTNISDAKETVATIMFDLQNGHIGTKKQQEEGRNGLLSLLKKRNTVVVDWIGYEKIDAVEKSRKRSESQPREKIVSLKEMIEVASRD